MAIVSKQFDWRLEDQGQVLTPTTLVDFTDDLAYGGTLISSPSVGQAATMDILGSVTGGSESYTLSLQSGTLPAGVSLTTTGTSGSFTTEGAFSATFRAADDNDGQVLDIVWSGTVAAASDPYAAAGVVAAWKHNIGANVLNDAGSPAADLEAVETLLNIISGQDNFSQDFSTANMAPYIEGKYLDFNGTSHVYRTYAQTTWPTNAGILIVVRNMGDNQCLMRGTDSLSVTGFFIHAQSAGTLDSCSAPFVPTTIHVDNGAHIGFTRDNAHDAIVGSTPRLVEGRGGMDLSDFTASDQIEFGRKTSTDNRFGGDWGALVVVDMSVISAGDLQAIRDDLATDYGITLA